MTTTATKTACFHCGDECPDHPILLAEKPFCCEGCKTVFEILNANDLCQFYRIEDKAGISQRGKKTEQYAWLDDPEAAEKLLDFDDENISRITLYLPQIHCASCIWLVENLYKLTPGVLASKVNFLKKEAYLTFFNEKTSLRKVVETLASIGYAPELNLGTLEKARTKKPVSRRLIFQLGVAGFAFGNIMLLSFPEYIGLAESETWFRQLFGYFNLLLATPVAFFSGRDYLTGMWHSIRTRNFGIDIPLGLGILVLYFRSAFEIISGTGAGYMDSLGGLVFFLLIGKWFQQITYHRISFERDYKSYFPVAALKIKGGRQESVSVNKLEPGDTILVRHKEIIPGDGILKKGTARMDYSFVTGEAEPVERHSGDKIFAGGRQMGDAIELTLTKKVSQSYLTQLWNEDAFHQEKLAGASRLANSVSRYFTAVILLISLLALAFWLPKDARTAFNAFTAVLIIACPCAAALNIPFTLGNAVRILARRGFFIKNTNAIEALNRITAVVFDKTGTLTHASAGDELRYDGKTLSEQEKAWFKGLAMHSTHPVSRQLFDNLQPVGEVKPFYVADFQEFTGQGISGKVGERRLRIGSKAFLRAGEPRWSGDVFIELDGEVVGGFSLRNRYRDNAWDVLVWFQKQSKTYLLSGDNERERAYLESKFVGATLAVAHAWGTPNFGHSDVGGNPDVGDRKGRPYGDVLHFHQSPKDKLDFIKNLQARGEKVLMLGDGLNDAGALQQSEVGIVVAEDANNFTPACDAILDARQFARLPQFLAFAKSSERVVYGAWLLAALYNVVGLTYAVQGLLSPVVAAILMPASSLTIVAFGVGMTMLLANRKLKN